MSSAGRNDPCPCGSGRKFKHCCLPKQGEADAARVRIRSAEGRVLMAAFKHAIATWGQPLLDHAWEDFWLYDDVPEEMPAEPEWEGMFMAWFTLAFVADPECPEATEAWPAEPIARHWLASLGTAADPMDRTFVEQACRPRPRIRLPAARNLRSIPASVATILSLAAPDVNPRAHHVKLSDDFPDREGLHVPKLATPISTVAPYDLRVGRDARFVYFARAPARDLGPLLPYTL